MVEYGNGVGQVAGQGAGGHASRSVDVGTAVGQFMGDSVHTLSTLPPTTLLAILAGIVIGLLVLRHAS